MQKIKRDSGAEIKLYGSPNGIQPEMNTVNLIVASIFEKYGYDSEITCGLGKSHKKYSLHPVGFALDYKSKHIATDKAKFRILEELKLALPNCDIILEHLGKAQEHYHIEFDDHNDPQYQRDKTNYKRTGEWVRGT